MSNVAQIGAVHGNVYFPGAPAPAEGGAPVVATAEVGLSGLFSPHRPTYKVDLFVEAVELHAAIIVGMRPVVVPAGSPPPRLKGVDRMATMRPRKCALAFDEQSGLHLRTSGDGFPCSVAGDGPEWFEIHGCACPHHRPEECECGWYLELFWLSKGRRGKLDVLEEGALLPFDSAA